MASVVGASLVRRNTTYALANGACVTRTLVHASHSCSLPGCEQTRQAGKLFVLTNRDSREWVAYVFFDLAEFVRLRNITRIVDVELQLTGTGLCHRRAAWGNFTHQLHLLRAREDPSRLANTRPYTRKRLAAQWSRMQIGENYRIPLHLNRRQLSALAKHGRLHFLLSERLTDASAADKTLEETCGYYSSTSSRGDAVVPKLQLTYAWRCCKPAESAAAGNDDAMSSSSSGTDGVSPVRPPWIRPGDWSRLARRARLPMPWHSRLATNPPPWVYEHRNDAVASACAPPDNASVARGGQVAVPPGEPPAVSVIVAYHNSENMTARCMEALWACADELPSVEYLFVDDGSDEPTGELSETLGRLSRSFGIRYELTRYPVSIGFTMVTSEAARRANGTYLLFLNNDAFVRRHALRALFDMFATHADLGVVGAKLVGTDGQIQEAGAVLWADSSGAWFHKYMPLFAGRVNDQVNHRLNYVRETDYVSAAVAMVPRALFVDAEMFDVHFTPGYYEDTDLSFTARARGFRVLYTPFAHVVHMAHSTYKESMDALLDRNKQQFAAKWRPQLREHMPPCNKAAACHHPNKPIYTHATRGYSYRLLWLDMVLPEPDRDSGSVRTLTMLKLLLAMRCHVTIASVHRSGGGQHQRYTRMLQYLGVHVLPDFRLLERFAVREPFDFVIVARRDTYAAARELLRVHYPTTLLVFDTVDLHFQRERVRRAFLAQHADEPELLADVFGGDALRRLGNATGHAEARALELDAVEASAVAIVVSETERAALRAELRADGREVPNLVVLANAHQPAPPTTRPFRQRHGLVFVGNFNHLPNRDAVLYFARRVLPRLLRVPVVHRDAGFVFHVAGANRIPKSILALNHSSPDGVVRIVVHGYLPELRPLYASMRVSVAPLRWGAGVKGKVNTAHQLGVPVVCTRLAADGMHAKHGEHVLLGDTPEELAASVLQAYYNASLWRRLRRLGAALLESKSSASRAGTGLLQVLAHLRDANTHMRLKSLALAHPRPRAYADLRSAAALGGFYFNLTSLAPRLEFSNAPGVERGATCPVGAAGGGAGAAVAATPHQRQEQQILQRIASSAQP